MESTDGLATLVVALLVVFLLRNLARVYRRGARRLARRPQAKRASAPITGRTTARVLQVIDGDTVDVKARGQRIRVRLSAIDCPENGQPWGNIATAGLIKLIGGKSVILEVHDVDDYGRTLATVFVKHHQEPGMINVNERMVMLGHAWVLRQYCTHLPADRRRQLDRLEKWARSKRVGLWKTPNPIPPWKWRRGP